MTKIDAVKAYRTKLEADLRVRKHLADVARDAFANGDQEQGKRASEWAINLVRILHERHNGQVPMLTMDELMGSTEPSKR
ncbi:MAG: hypothetical protein ACR2OR_00530 [Hyphomicrobiales bacterium]